MASLGTLILKLANLRRRERLEMVWKLEFGKSLMMMGIKDFFKSKRKESEPFAEMERLARTVDMGLVQNMEEFLNGFMIMSILK